jgi:hypothetical protein
MSYHKLEADALVAKFRWRRSQVGRALYNGYWLSNLIGLIHFNLYSALSRVVEQYSQGNSLLESVGPSTALSVFAVALVHPLDTLKYICVEI